MKKILFLLICATIAKEQWWELIRCEYKGEVCYLHHTMKPSDDVWTMECFEKEKKKYGWSDPGK